MEFENKIINGIHVSRYVASWSNVSGGKYRFFFFEDWLRQLVINGRSLTEDEIRYIYNYATNGKLELEANARTFIQNI